MSLRAVALKGKGEGRDSVRELQARYAHYCNIYNAIARNTSKEALLADERFAALTQRNGSSLPLSQRESFVGFASLSLSLLLLMQWKMSSRVLPLDLRMWSNRIFKLSTKTNLIGQIIKNHSSFSLLSIQPEIYVIKAIIIDDSFQVVLTWISVRLTLPVAEAL